MRKVAQSATLQLETEKQIKEKKGKIMSHKIILD